MPPACQCSQRVQQRKKHLIFHVCILLLLFFFFFLIVSGSTPLIGNWYGAPPALGPARDTDRRLVVRVRGKMAGQ